MDYNDEELDEIAIQNDDEMEVNAAGNAPVAQIVKRLTTPNSEISTTFRGDEVVSYSIEPQGVVKAQIDTTLGIINFEKYDEDWYGEVTLNLQTESGEYEQYISDYTVCFETQGEETEDVEETAFINDDIEVLSDDEEESSGGYIKTTAQNLFYTMSKGTKTKTYNVIPAQFLGLSGLRITSKTCLMSTSGIKCSFSNKKMTVKRSSAAICGTVKYRVNVATSTKKIISTITVYCR